MVLTITISGMACAGAQESAFCVLMLARVLHAVTGTPVLTG
jgi:hypothetical protein